MNVLAEKQVTDLLERIAKALELIAASQAIKAVEPGCEMPGLERQAGELFSFTFHEVYGKD